MSDAIVQDLTTRGHRPNILMLFSDEHNASMAGFMGHPIVQTPNLDRLAAEGVVFENAYCNSPLCSPSRQSFMAGLHCHAIDMWNNTSAMPADTVTWAHMLSLAGYETSLFGKMHFNGYQKMYGFDRRPVPEGSNAGESFYSWGLRTSHQWTDPLPYTSGDMRDELMHAGPDTPERQAVFRKDIEVRQAVIADLQAKAAEGFDRPWAICASFVLPHPPWKARPDILARYRGKADLPFNQEGAGRDACDRNIQQFVGDLMNLPESAIRNAREVYFALISEFEGEGWNHPRAFVRSSRYKYVYNHTADCRLHDLQADPHEMQDLSDDPALAEVRQRLHQRITDEWGDGDEIERRVLLAQARRKIARCKNVCKDLGW